MPNWMTHRINITGPAFELERLLSCIRAPEGESERTLDFEALRPMPDAIRATQEDDSAEAKDRARRVTGYQNWYDWSLAHWGTKWNSSAFQELVWEQERYACLIDTAWSYPKPIFWEMAREFPLLTIRVFSIEEGCGLAIVSDLRDGSCTSAEVAVSRKFRHLVYSPDPIGFPDVPVVPPDIAPYMNGTGLGAKVFGIRDSEHAESVVQRAWHEAHAGFTAEQLARLFFAEDVYGYLEWLELNCGDSVAPSWDEAQDALAGYVESEQSLRFLTDQSRCATNVDRAIVHSVAERLDPRMEDQTDATLVSLSGAPHTDEDMREWATYAIARGENVNMCDSTTLLESISKVGEQLYHRVLHDVGTNIRSS